MSRCVNEAEVSRVGAERSETRHGRPRTQGWTRSPGPRVTEILSYLELSPQDCRGHILRNIDKMVAGPKTVCQDCVIVFEAGLLQSEKSEAL